MAKFDNIKNFIANNELEKVFSFLLDKTFSGNNELEKQVIMLSANYYELKNKERYGLISHEEEFVFRNKLIKGLLEIVADLEKEQVSTKSPRDKFREVKKGDGNSIIVLMGAGASRMLGLQTLENLIDSFSDLESISNINKYQNRNGNKIKINNIITETWKSIKGSQKSKISFENVIGQLKKYSHAADIIRDHRVFYNEFGDVPIKVYNLEFKKIWEVALVECYRIIFNHYGPGNAINPSEELKCFQDLLISFSKFNDNILDVFTTNYDCVFTQLSSHNPKVHLNSRINQANGHFEDKWFSLTNHAGTHLSSEIFIHRLHGCVAWYKDDELPFKVRAYNTISEFSEIDSLLNRMAIKLIPEELIGINPAFSLEYKEFKNYLRTCEVLLVWGHSFADIEVLRAVKDTLESRKNSPFYILVIDPYKSKNDFIDIINNTLSVVPGEKLDTNYLQKYFSVLDWVLQDGYVDLLEKVTLTLDGWIKK